MVSPVLSPGSRLEMRMEQMICAECGQPVERDGLLTATVRGKVTARLHGLISNDPSGYWATCSEAWLNKHIRDGLWDSTKIGA